MWSPNICRSLWPIFHGPLNLPFILNTVWCMNITHVLLDYESVWHHIWPWNKCMSLWPIFHGPVILPYILNSIYERMSYFWKMSQCNTTFDLKINFMSQWPIFHGPVISLLLFFALKDSLVLLAKPDSGELRCPGTILIQMHSQTVSLFLSILCHK